MTPPSPKLVVSWWENIQPILVVGVALLVVMVTYKLYNGIVKSRRRREWARVGKDVVVLHIPGRGRWAPNMSPFALKLETFLRYSQIPYQVDFSEPFGPKGKTPWITLNGEEIGDSQIVVDLLTQVYQVDTHLTKEQEAVAKAFTTLVDEHLIWCLRVWRYDVDRGEDFFRAIHLGMSFARLLIALQCWQMRWALWFQGVGRHTYTQVQHFARKDLRAISDFLGEKTYLFGEALTTADCVLFAHLANLVYNYSRSPFYTILTEELPNLEAYVDRVKSKLWQDWDKCLDP